MQYKIQCEINNASCSYTGETGLITVYFDYLALHKTVNVNLLQDRNSNQKFKRE